MWPYDKELEAWFDDVRRRHEAERGGGADVMETPPLMRNDLAPR